MVSRKIMAVIVAAGIATAAGCGHEDAARIGAGAPVEIDVVAASVDQTNATAVAHEFLSEFFDWRPGEDAPLWASIWADDHLASHPEARVSMSGASEYKEDE